MIKMSGDNVDVYLYQIFGVLNIKIIIDKKCMLILCVRVCTFWKLLNNITTFIMMLYILLNYIIFTLNLHY